MPNFCLYVPTGVKHSSDDKVDEGFHVRGSNWR